jgi:gas vesicle protein
LRIALGSRGKQTNSTSEQELDIGTAASSFADELNKATAQATDGCERTVRKMVDNLEEEKASDSQKVSKNQGNM